MAEHKGLIIIRQPKAMVAGEWLESKDGLSFTFYLGIKEREIREGNKLRPEEGEQTCQLEGQEIVKTLLGGW